VRRCSLETSECAEMFRDYVIGTNDSMDRMLRWLAVNAIGSGVGKGCGKLGPDLDVAESRRCAVRLLDIEAGGWYSWSMAVGEEVIVSAFCANIWFVCPSSAVMHARCPYLVDPSSCLLAVLQFVEPSILPAETSARCSSLCFSCISVLNSKCPVPIISDFLSEPIVGLFFGDHFP